MIYVSNQRLEVPADDATGRGFDFAITVDDKVFKVRNYMDRPGEFAIINPNAARKSPQIRELVNYLVSVLGGQRMFFYNAHGGAYEEIDLQTLEFKTDESAAIQNRPEINAHRDTDSTFENMRLFPA